MSLLLFTRSTLILIQVLLQVVGYFNGAENRFTIRNDSILWPAPNNKPPLNEPHCGYEGDKDICHVGVTT